MSNLWPNKLFGGSATDCLTTSARDYMVSLCNEVKQFQRQAFGGGAAATTGAGDLPISGDESGGGGDETTPSKTDDGASTVDDYHPNTPTSSVVDEKDIFERNIDANLIVDNFDEVIDLTKMELPFENYGDIPLLHAARSGGGGDKCIISLRDSSNSSDNLKHVSFFDPTAVGSSLVGADPMFPPYVVNPTAAAAAFFHSNATKAVVINESDMSSDESAGSPKHVADVYERSGARPKYINRSSLAAASYNSSNSTQSMVLDHSVGGRSPYSATSRSPGWASKLYDYPILFVSPHGTVAVYLREGCIVEMTIDKTIRVECHGKFSAATNSHGNINCILHPDGRILQQDTRVQCLFGKNKVASFGPQGVIFNMKPLPMAYVVSSTLFKGTTSVPANCMRLPPMDYDFTMTVFYNQSVIGPDTVPRCQEMVRQANYKFREDGSITVLINGVFVRQDRFGNVLVNSRPRTIRASPQKNTVSVRTHFVDMAVQEDEKAYVKRGVKRVHVSKSGMVVSDGNCITSMDHFGRIVSSS